MGSGDIAITLAERVPVFGEHGGELVTEGDVLAVAEDSANSRRKPVSKSPP